jgi:hypothetical protein
MKACPHLFSLLCALKFPADKQNAPKVRLSTLKLLIYGVYEPPGGPAFLLSSPIFPANFFKSKKRRKMLPCPATPFVAVGASAYPPEG